MRFRRWDPGRVRVGNEKDIPNLHQDYGTRKQRKEQDDFIRGDLSGLSGFRGIFEKIGIVWGCDLLTESTDLGSSIGGVFDNQGTIFFPFNRRFVWIQQRFPRSNRKLGYGHYFSLGSSYDGRSWSIVFLFLFFLISSQSTLFCIASVVLWCSSISVSEYKILCWNKICFSGFSYWDRFIRKNVVLVWRSFVGKRCLTVSGFIIMIMQWNKNYYWICRYGRVVSMIFTNIGLSLFVYLCVCYFLDYTEDRWCYRALFQKRGKMIYGSGIGFGDGTAFGLIKPNAD